MAGALLGAGLANGFLALHVVISLVAVYAAWRLRIVMRRPANVMGAITADADQAGAEMIPTGDGDHRGSATGDRQPPSPVLVA